MIWHEAVRKDAHVEFLSSFLEKLLKELIVGVSVEYLYACVRTIQNVIDVVAG